NPVDFHLSGAHLKRLFQRYVAVLCLLEKLHRSVDLVGIESNPLAFIAHQWLFQLDKGLKFVPADRLSTKGQLPLVAQDRITGQDANWFVGLALDSGSCLNACTSAPPVWYQYSKAAGFQQGQGFC